jgi:DNA-binding Lrp family transcriptional regulator
MEYQEIFRALAAKPVRARFDEKELEMLRILSTEPFLSFSDMSRRLRLSMPTTMRLFTNLSAKSSLSSFLMANVDLLGLTDFFMFMNTSRKSELRRILFRIPYCRVVYSLYGSADVFALIDVPFQESEFPRKMADRLRSAGVASQVILCQSEHNFGGLNFQSYDLKAKDWDIHWNSWGGILRERLSAMSKVNMASLHHQPNKLEWIRKIDLQIMERLFSNCRRSHEQIGDMLGVTGAYVGKRVRRLLQNNVFRPVMAPRKMGAEDHGLLLLSCPRDRVGIIASGFDLLPRWRGAQVSGDVEGLLAEVYVPTGQIDQLFKQVDEQLVARHFVDGCRFHVVGTWSQPIVRWLPANLYSDETGWAFDSEKYLALVP